MSYFCLSGLSAGIRSSILCVIAALFFATDASAVNRIITPGQFSTNSVGAATYSVPIEVPPGTNGLVPKLSLEYNSHRGDGLVGVGWSLAGRWLAYSLSPVVPKRRHRMVCVDGLALMKMIGSA